jgi:hypothetical protein
MKTKIFTLLIMTLVLFSFGCLQSDLGRINQLSFSINDHLKKGDEFYNQAATDTNDYKFDSAIGNCDNALVEFKLAKTSADEALIYATNSKDSVFTEYIQDVLGEIDAKSNATSELKQAIGYFQAEDNSTANYHVGLANGFMDKATGYKTEREGIVKQNPVKFKTI